jgi:hypothetical protein
VLVCVLRGDAPLARRYLRARAAELVIDGQVDIEPRLRILAEGCGFDPDEAVAEAQRVIAELSHEAAVDPH